MTDWGTGGYERTAGELAPAAAHVVRRARIAAGERVLDVGTGTGNAALEAARAGGEVTGADPAERLLEVARGRAADEGLAATFVAASAEELPFEDGSFDVALSVFGIVFATDPERAVAELLRVVRVGGRALITAWMPEGAVHASLGVIGRAVAEVTGSTGRGAPFAWSDADALRKLAKPQGATVTTEHAEIAFTAESPDAFLREAEEHHPLSLQAQAVLEPAGRYPGVRAQALAVLEARNEDPAAFRATSRYLVARLDKRV